MGIRLSSQAGFPLAPHPVEFAVPDTPTDIEEFYLASSECADVSVDVFRNPFGEFDHGQVDCLRHEHEGDVHQHNCVRVDEYPVITP